MAKISFILNLIAGILGILLGIFQLISGAAGASGLQVVFLNLFGVIGLGIIEIVFAGIILLISSLIEKEKNGKTGSIIILIIGILILLILPMGSTLFGLLAVISGILGLIGK